MRKVVFVLLLTLAFAVSAQKAVVEKGSEAQQREKKESEVDQISTTRLTIRAGGQTIDDSAPSLASRGEG